MSREQSVADASIHSRRYILTPFVAEPGMLNSAPSVTANGGWCPAVNSLPHRRERLERRPGWPGPSAGVGARIEDHPSFAGTVQGNKGGMLTILLIILIVLVLAGGFGYGGGRYRTGGIGLGGLLLIILLILLLAGAL